MPSQTLYSSKMQSKLSVIHIACPCRQYLQEKTLLFHFMCERDNAKSFLHLIIQSSVGLNVSQC